MDGCCRVCGEKRWSEMDAVSHGGKAIRVDNIIIEQNSGRAETFAFTTYSLLEN